MTQYGCASCADARASRRFGAAAATALALWAGVALGAAQAAVVSCPAVITSCGCTITDASVHTQGVADLDISSGATSKGDCIDIKHAGATLDCDFGEITGAGSGVGVRILSGAKRASIQNCLIAGWDVGIEDDANSANITDNEIAENGTAGILLKGANKSVVDDFCSSDNTGVGVMLQNSNNNTFIDFDAGASGFCYEPGNGGDGITLVGSNRNSFADFDADDNGGNGVTFKNSSKNSLAGFDIEENTTDGVFIDPASNDKVTDGDVLASGVNGVEIDNGSHNNSVVFVFTTSNPGTGLLDHNSNCDKNVWTNNCFDSASPACASNTNPDVCL